MDRKMKDGTASEAAATKSMPSSPALAVHAGDFTPCVCFWVVDFHRAEPRLAVIPTDSVQQPVDHSHTHSTPGRAHLLTAFPTVSDWIKHFHHV